MNSKSVLVGAGPMMAAPSSLSSRVMPSRRRSLSLRRRVESSVWLGRLARYYSRMLGEQVTPRYALCLTHAQVAVWALVFPVAMPLSARALCLLWAALAVRQCRKNA